MQVEVESLEDVALSLSEQTYRQPTSIHHWQLRDLVSAAPDSEDAFYVVADCGVLRYDAAGRAARAVAALDFTPNSMTVGHGHLAAGGLHGQLEVRDLCSGESLFSGAVGGTVNNALHIARHSDGSARLFVCCNDSTIKVFALPGMARAATIRCPCPINYCALSPSGTHLVAVGDCEPTLLYQATDSGYAMLSSFTEACDVGMCCAWSAHGSLLASCHQDGSVGVWDHRSGACVARLLLPTAARCLKFSAAPLDLLAVSEHEDRVTLLDARDWGSKQVLELHTQLHSPDSSPGGAGSRPVDISGLAFTPSGQRLWVGTEEGCMSFDVDSGRRTTFGAASIT